jgi:3',5'-cyclic AMP phosphodiesterase CpdA
MKPKLCLLLILLTVISAATSANEKTILTSRENTKTLSTAKRDEAFTFIVFGDVKSGSPAGLEVLRKAVSETNNLDPDFVFTVGDLVDGYHTPEIWIRQMKEFRPIINGLKMPWFPVAGNHDVYWNGAKRPAGGHRDNFERHFGPVWYAYKHKDCWFISLFTDEGDLHTGEHGYKTPEKQIMSKAQKSWLKSILDIAKDDKHVFVFMHHPRWKKGSYGNDWDNVHKMLKQAGNVSAVFAGHEHFLQYDGVQDGIAYYVLGTTGGGISKEHRERGEVPCINMVTVRGEKFNLSVIPIGKIIHPNDLQFSYEKLYPKRRWGISSPDERTLEYKFQVEKTPQTNEWLQIGIEGAADDSGDYGLHYRLTDNNGKTVDREFIWFEGVKWFEYKITKGGEYTVMLQDRDTVFEGKYPGNGGSLEIIHKKTKPLKDY